MKKMQIDKISNFSYNICIFYTIEIVVKKLINASTFDVLNTWYINY